MAPRKPAAEYMAYGRAVRREERVYLLLLMLRSSRGKDEKEMGVEGGGRIGEVTKQ